MPFRIGSSYFASVYVHVGALKLRLQALKMLRFWSLLLQILSGIIKIQLQTKLLDAINVQAVTMVLDACREKMLVKIYKKDLFPALFYPRSIAE
jgi:hypothetical protein